MVAGSNPVTPTRSNVKSLPYGRDFFVAMREENRFAGSVSAMKSPAERIAPDRVIPQRGILERRGRAGGDRGAAGRGFSGKARGNPKSVEPVMPLRGSVWSDKADSYFEWLRERFAIVIFVEKSELQAGSEMLNGQPGRPCNFCHCDVRSAFRLGSLFT